jgi:multiple sugar transport system permease protein
MTSVAIRHRVRMTPLARREARQGLLFISPWLVGFVLFTAIPMVATLAFTFTNLSLSQEEPLRFVGLDNYRDLAADRQAWSALVVTLKFALLWVPFAVLAPLGLALWINARRVRAKSAFRVLFFLPYVVPFIAAVLVWLQMLGENGWINQVLRLVGWSDPPIWIHSPDWVHTALLIMGVWSIGAGLVIDLAALRNIPSELYDAARIDGAGAWSQLRFVTLPMMSPVIFYSLILSVVGVLQYFLVPLVIHNGTGDPGGATMFYNLYLYKTFFTFQDMSYGATLAWFLFGISVVLTLILFRLSRRWVYYAGER